MELREIANTSNRGMNLATALQVPMWAHHVYVKAGEKIPDAITRCNIHWLTLDTWSQPTLPDFIAKLPRLNYLEVRNAGKLEFVEGTSRKFWEATVKGSEFTVRYGRIGTEGQRVTKSFASPAAAAAERDKLVAQKRRKGYG
jgi:predicted DNA-binding WGR domain protein